jgi:hypothetical protein
MIDSWGLYKLIEFVLCGETTEQDEKLSAE